MPDVVEAEIRRLAAEKRISLSKASVMLIQRALGINPDQENKRDLIGIAGSWEQNDMDEFRNNTRQFEQIDDEIWK